MPDEPKEPRPHGSYSVEDRGKAKAAFTRAHDNAPASEKAQGEGSDMVRDTGLRPEHRPTGPMRDGPDRAAHNASLARDQARAEQLNSFAAEKSRKTAQKQIELSRGKDSKDRTD